ATSSEPLAVSGERVPRAAHGSMLEAHRLKAGARREPRDAGEPKRSSRLPAPSPRQVRLGIFRPMTLATAPASLKRTPFYDKHVALGAKIVPFAGWEMPVNYPQGITAEHKAVRERCGLFDVSHMGECIIRRDGAIDFVNSVTTND